MLDFARALPSLRERVAADLTATEELSRDRVLACAIRLLDRGFFRIGSEDYAARNETYGLATMRKDHVKLLEGGAVEFDYVAKSGKQQIKAVIDPDVRELLSRLKRRRGGGAELLAYRERRQWCDIRSADINAYVKEATGADFSAKDFRTWNATAIAAVALAVAGEVAGTRTGRKRAMNRAVKEVAYYLGNTPAVCRASYIDPRVFDRYQAGVTIGGVLGEDFAARTRPGEPPHHDPLVEEAVLDLLSEKGRFPALEKVA